MIKNVSFEKTTFNELPFKFEAGTPDYIGSTALAKALDYVSAIGMDHIAAYEHELTQYAMKRLKEIPGMRILEKRSRKVVSFHSWWVTSIILIWVRCSTVWGLPYVPDITVRNR